MDEKKKLAQLDDLVIDQILSQPESELRPDVDDAVVQAVRRDVERARALLGKADLAQAKVELAAYRANPKVVNLRNARSADELKTIRARDKELDRKLTIAARNAEAASDSDADGIEDDLAELEKWEAGERNDP